jgi:hypothetical protein
VAGPGAQPRRGRTTALIALLAGALLAVGVAVVWIVVDNRGRAEPAAKPAEAPAAGPAVAGTAGFDLYVTPAHVAAWRLDGETRTTDLPARINGLAPGRHTVAIDAPPGFMSESLELDLQPGELRKVEITLTAIEITGIFESDPPGATVRLVSGAQQIDVGPTPARHRLDPAQRYEVVFEKDGYVSVSKPITISGQGEERVVAVLEPVPAAVRGGAAAKRDPVVRKDPAVKKDPVAVVERRDPVVERKDPVVERKEPAARGEGILSLGSKPPCDIYVDGKATGLKTPQRELKLPAGRRKITLMNNEFGIKESFTVEIKAGEVLKQVKDFSDRMQ